MESNFREIVKSQHADYLGALDRANIDIQKRLWSDMEKIRQEYDRLIHTELRLIRQRAPVASCQDRASVQQPGTGTGRSAVRLRPVRRTIPGAGGVRPAQCGVLQALLRPL